VEWKKPGADAAEAEFELYDYEADPLEKRNLAKEQVDVVESLRKILATHPEAKPQMEWR
jgi:iduronate 2-sulfatase